MIKMYTIDGVIIPIRIPLKIPRATPGAREARLRAELELPPIAEAAVPVEVKSKLTEVLGGRPPPQQVK